MASFFLALKTRHWTVPIGIAFAAAISWYSHSSTKRKVSASRSFDSRNAGHRLILLITEHRIYYIFSVLIRQDLFVY